MGAYTNTFVSFENERVELLWVGSDKNLQKHNKEAYQDAMADTVWYAGKDGWKIKPRSTWVVIRRGSGELLALPVAEAKRYGQKDSHLYESLLTRGENEYILI